VSLNTGCRAWITSHERRAATAFAAPGPSGIAAHAARLGAMPRRQAVHCCAIFDRHAALVLPGCADHNHLVPARESASQLVGDRLQPLGGAGNYAS
jgi:hypothetical protein